MSDDEIRTFMDQKSYDWTGKGSWRQDEGAAREKARELNIDDTMPFPDLVRAIEEEIDRGDNAQ